MTRIIQLWILIKNHPKIDDQNHPTLDHPKMDDQNHPAFDDISIIQLWMVMADKFHPKLDD